MLDRSPPVTSPPPRCPRCLFPAWLCLCAEARRIATPVRFVLLRHASEIPRLTGTARWAALALEGAQVLDYGVPGRPLDPAPLSAPGPWLLYPSPHPPAAPAAPPRRIVVPDGTWAQARRMIQRVPALRALPRLAVAPRAAGLRIRRPPQGGMSTIEAIAAALELLGHAAAAERLQALHAEGVARVRRLGWVPAAA